MKITLTGSLGNISKPLALQLITNGHEVTVISSNADKKDSIESMGAIAAIGSVEDQAFLNSAFLGADVVYTMIPPALTAPDTRKHMKQIGENYAEAIKSAGIKKVVNLSSIGAHLPGGTGPIAGIYDEEQTFAALDGVAIIHLRAAYFYINFLNNIDMIKHAGILWANYSAQAKLALVHPNDIADAAVAAIESEFSGKQIRYVVSDVKTFAEVTAALGKAIGQPELPWIEFTDEQALDGMLKAGLPANAAANFLEMGTAIRSGKLMEHYDATQPVISGKIKLADFAAEFAEKFNQ